MSSPVLEDDELRRDERVRIGAALAALARRAPVRLKPGRRAEQAPTAHAPQPAPYSPWTRRSRPLYKF